MASGRQALRGVAVLVAAFLATSGLAVAPATAGAASDSVVSINSVSVGSTQTAGKLLAYWTPQRRRQATPEKPVRVDPAATTDVPPSRLPARSRPGTTPKLRASRVGDVGVQDVTTAQPWGPHGQLPATTIGKLYYTRDDGSAGYCSASVINAENLSTIWTAGHCVHGGGAGHGWFTDFLFMPDYDNGTAIGSWTWKQVTATNGWVQNGDWQYDMAAIALWPNDLGRVADYTGSQGYKFGQGYSWNVDEFGYPQDAVPARTDLNGEHLYYCQGPTSENSGFMEIGCDMFHGASGGPWLDDLQASRGWGYIVGANSWHYFDFSVYRSAYHGDAAIDVFDAIRNV
ncbi:trypsin-like serine peptidase [Actinophytocola sp.]|uniref:trypsin-like serine peptidase n=1 Tax=Actinophytocola sp. TaxID=1872138 RepID=UPI0038999C77